jgi:hypothetical protein
MKWLFLQVWLYCLVSFLLGVLVTWLFMRRKKVKEFTTEHAGEAGGASPDAEPATVGAVGAGAGEGSAGRGRHAAVDADVKDQDVDTEVNPPRVDADVAAPSADADEPAGAAPVSAVDADTNADVEAPDVDTEVSAPEAAADDTVKAGAGGYELPDASAPAVAVPGNGGSSATAPEPEPEPGPESEPEREPVAATVDAGTPVGVAADGAAAPVAESSPASLFEAGRPEPAPYGEGSAKPLADGSAPSPDYTVKGNEDSMLFHTTASPYYGRTKAEVWFKTEGDAERAGFTRWDRKAAPADAVAPHPRFGEGAAEPLTGGAAPSGDFSIKGNEDSMLYHTTASPYYGRTIAEVWFKTEEDAEQAGFTAWNRRRSAGG